MTYCAVRKFGDRYQVKHFPLTLPMVNAIENAQRGDVKLWSFTQIIVSPKIRTALHCVKSNGSSWYWDENSTLYMTEPGPYTRTAIFGANLTLPCRWSPYLQSRKTLRSNVLILGAPLRGVFSKTVDTINEFFCNIYVMRSKLLVGRAYSDNGLPRVWDYTKWVREPKVTRKEWVFRSIWSELDSINSSESELSNDWT